MSSVKGAAGAVSIGRSAKRQVVDEQHTGKKEDLGGQEDYFRERALEPIIMINCSIHTVNRLRAPPSVRTPTNRE